MRCCLDDPPRAADHPDTAHRWRIYHATREILAFTTNLRAIGRCLQPQRSSGVQARRYEAANPNCRVANGHSTAPHRYARTAP